MDINRLKNIKIPKELEEELAQDTYIDEFGFQYTYDSLLKGIVRSSLWGDDSRKSSGNNTGDTGSNVDVELDPSLFKRNPKGWNIRNACQWLQSNSHSASTHRCAKYVRSAIDVGFNTDPNDCNLKSPTCSYTLKKGRPTWAWMYINFLPTIGFKHIGTYTQNGYTPEPGDIAVYFKDGNDKVPGHICMWTGVKWCSDFKQNNMIVYRNTKEAYIFRFQ